MKIINLTQGTKEWLDFRRQHIGASDCAAILGKDPFKTKLTVYYEKLGKESEVTPAMQRGKLLEPKARDYFAKKYEVEWQPVVGVHEDYPWLMASLDGWDGFTVLEIKCLGERRFREVQRSGKPFEEHMWQLQHELAVSEANAGILGYYFVNDAGEEESVEICTSPDPEMIKELTTKLNIFWQEHIVPWNPPESSSDDFLERLDKDWLDAEEECLEAYEECSEIEEQLKAAEKKYSAAESKLKKLAGKQSCKGDLFKVHFNPARQSPIVYANVPEVQALSKDYLDGFRGAPKPYYTVTRLKEPHS